MYAEWVPRDCRGCYNSWSASTFRGGWEDESLNVIGQRTSPAWVMALPTGRTQHYIDPNLVSRTGDARRPISPAGCPASLAA